MSNNCYPAYIYAIFTLDEKDKICGVYVGRSVDPERRVAQHRYDYCDHKEMHDLMLYNGYAYKIIDKITRPEDDCIEYEWIDYFYHVCKQQGWKLFNRILGDSDYICVLHRHVNCMPWHVWQPKK